MSPVIHVDFSKGNSEQESGHGYKLTTRDIVGIVLAGGLIIGFWAGIALLVKFTLLG